MNLFESVESRESNERWKAEATRRVKLTKHIVSPTWISTCETQDSGFRMDEEGCWIIGEIYDDDFSIVQ